MRRTDLWTYKEMDILRFNYPKKPTAEVARMLKKSPRAVTAKAVRMGLKKGHVGVVWTPQMLKILNDFYPRMFNHALARWLQISERTLTRKAQELGLKKMDNFMKIRAKDIAARAEETRRNNPNRRTDHLFKKGEHHHPAGEFKKGRREDPETKAKRIAALKASLSKPEIKAKRSQIMKENWRKRKEAQAS